jgi:branched-chain amino acid transport system substrate-binding protein
MKMHRVPTLVSIIILLCFSSCKQPPQPPIKIGLSANLSGTGGTAGEHIRDGALLAVDHINMTGGINGRPLELLIRDDENSDEGIRKADESLINEQVVAIIGHSYSSNTVKAYPLVTSRETLLITAYTATTQLSGKDDLFIRTSVDCALYGKKTVDLLRQHDVSSIAFLMDMTNPTFVLDWVDHVKKGFSGSVHEVKFESREHVDWDTVINELLVPHPEAIMFLTEASMTGVALQKLRAKGYKGLQVATLWTQTPGLMRYAGSAAEGLSLVTYIDPDNQRREYLEFSKKMQERFNQTANARSTRSYEIVMILANALKRSEYDAFSLKKALLAEEYETLMGTLKFDRFGDVVRPVYEVVVRNGRFANKGEI